MSRGCRATVPVRLAVVLWIGVLPGCTPDEATGERVLRVGYSQEAPFSFLDGSGRVSGEGPELFRSVAAELGLPEPEWVAMDFRDLIPALVAGRIDAIAAGLFITPDRSAQVLFTHPTFCARPALVVPVDRPDPPADGIYTASPVIRVAVLRSSVEEAALTALGATEPRVLPVPDLTTGLAALGTGVVDGLAISAPTARFLASGGEEVPLRALWPLPYPAAVEPYLRGCGGPAFSREDSVLVRSWNARLEAFLGSPEHLELVRPFGFTAEDLPAGGERRSAGAEHSP